MMDGMDDLVTWLRAQLAEDERVAQAASVDDPSWFISTLVDDSGVEFFAEIGDRPIGIKVGPNDDDEPLRRAEADHIVLNDPTFRLADIEAKRQILDLCDLEFTDTGAWIGIDESSETKWRVLQALALPYAESDGYREEWRP